MDVLVVRGPMYHSPGDENAFNTWLKRIGAVSRVQSRGADLHIQLRPGRLTADELREFRALFHRYGMDTSEIEALSQR
ncbi:hypothetical protein [Phenylobacterium kunshanense]|uniref:Uncharacterized protein n=1 Tax=Phenylobacterium kunshanense TaxID=1445034 RepID=A0A328B612_9CAUL|nr:hypothetical protein [Phenylobacterium kunshanense]RAK62035.1 hypothetical protein DJ019_20170 [Phenylobacterium kunshanense]